MNNATFLPLLLAALPALAGFIQHVPVDVEDSRRNFPLRVARGEVVDLSVEFLDGGAPLDLSGAEVALHTRTNGMDAALSWVTPGTATNNAACFVLDVDAVLPLPSGEWSVVATRGGRVLARAGGSAFVRGTAAGTAAAEPASVLAAYATTGYVDRAVAAATTGLLRAEEDPTVPSWAKAPNPPEPVELDPVFSAWRDDTSASFAGTAAYATYADSANSAVSASSAGSAAYADSAGTATSADSATWADSANSAYTAYSADTATSADSASTAGYSEEAGHASSASHAEEAVGLYWTALNGTLYTASEIVALATNRAPVSSTSAARWATGVLALTVPANGTLTADLAGWPDGAAVFCRLAASGAYTVAPTLSLLGYGSWPTNSASCVFVRDASRILVNVLEGN